MAGHQVLFQETDVKERKFKYCLKQVTNNSIFNSKDSNIEKIALESSKDAKCWHLPLTEEKKVFHHIDNLIQGQENVNQVNTYQCRWPHNNINSEFKHLHSRMQSGTFILERQQSGGNLLETFLLSMRTIWRKG